ncbi:MAG TPA: metallophosphoesterase [Usitatibacter sp.]|nr:metallophosphoesterase [Usitatibacter sp.]
MREAAARLLCAVALLALAACAGRAPHPDAFSFAVLGDVPYNAQEEQRYLEMLKAIDAEPLAFTLHVGDFKGGGACSDEIYARRKAQFDASAHPFIYTPGDNEWTACRRASMGSMDPLERLARLREVFFADRRSLGRQRIWMGAQDQCLDPGPAGCRCTAYPENRFWTRAGVRFVTLNVPGSDNNVGFDAASDAEARCRDEANRRWLEQAVRASERSETRALVIAFQTNPWETNKNVYRGLLAQIEEASRRVRKPVLVIHGHTHTARVDTPFKDTLGNVVIGITRLEVFGSPFVGWTRVDVDPDDPQVFTFAPKLVAVVPPP